MDYTVYKNRNFLTKCCSNNFVFDMIADWLPYLFEFIENNTLIVLLLLDKNNKNGRKMNHLELMSTTCNSDAMLL